MIVVPPEPFPEQASRLASLLTQHLVAGGDTEPHLAAVIAESLSRPGRLFRATLVWRTLTGLGGEPALADSLACGVEYFHLASLLLDDLPCMDNATMRRGFPCPHLEHGDATVILASLAFINRAYALIWRELAPLPQETRLKANDFLDRELGVAGVLNGQARDLRYGEHSPTAREAARIAVGKTVALFRLALAFPALVGGANPAELKHINGLCVHWGLFYQACNDLNDVASGVQPGNSAARDAAMARPNLLLALGGEAFDRRLDRLERQAAKNIAALVSINPIWRFLRGAQDSLFSAVTEPIRQSLASRTG